MSNQSVLTLSGVCKSYWGTRILQNVTLTLSEGKIYALLGMNGAGKSTLLRVISRHEAWDQGTGNLLGIDLERDDKRINERLGYVSENWTLTLPVPLKEMIRMFSQIYPAWDQGIFEKFVGAFKLDINRGFTSLSRGQRMQVAMAVVAATRPNVYLLDEISAVLDASARHFLMEFLRMERDQGRTILFATNIVTEVQNDADEVIILDKGAVRSQISLKAITEEYIKLRRPKGADHAVFHSAFTVPLSLNSDLSTSYLFPKQIFSAEFGSIMDSLNPWIDRRTVLLEEVFVYLTRREAKS